MPPSKTSRPATPAPESEKPDPSRNYRSIGIPALAAALTVTETSEKSRRDGQPPTTDRILLFG